MIGLVLVIALFALDADVRPYFFTWRNSILIFSQTAVIAVGALGMTLIIVSGGIDLSVGSAVALSSVVCATLLLNGAPAVAAAALAMLTGALRRIRQRRGDRLSADGAVHRHARNDGHRARRARNGWPAIRR